MKIGKKNMLMTWAITAVLSLAVLGMVALSLVVLGAANPSAAEEISEYTVDSFKAALSDLTDEAQVIAVCKEYVHEAEDLDLVRMVQSHWFELDPESARAFFRSERKKNPESARAVYLLGRIADTPLDKIEFGRRVIAIDSQNPYGYRLVLATYVNELFAAQASEDDLALLESELPQDEHLFAELMRLEPEVDYALEFMFDYLDYQGEYESALIILEDARDLEASWAEDTVFSMIYAKLGRYADALKVIEDQATSGVSDGYLAEDERAGYVQYFYERSLRKAKAYDEIIKFYKSQPDFSSNPQALYQVGCMFSLQAEPDQAFAYLDRAVAKGFVSVENVNDDNDLMALHNDPRWEDVVARIEANWEAGIEERRQKVLASKFSRPAPPWILKDVQGNEVNLADLRGHVLIFDFWATWCNPCRMAMPVLNTWQRQEAPGGVRVYSINVWEPFPFKAKKFMADNEYAMNLLFGNDEVVQAYGIEGIPYICVVDADGNIRYEEKGYEEGLGEKLNWWVEDLLAEVDSGS